MQTYQQLPNEAYSCITVELSRARVRRYQHSTGLMSLKLIWHGSSDLYCNMFAFNVLHCV